MRSPKDLETLASDFVSISNRSTGLVEKIGLERLLKRPAPDSWSAAECLTHLKLSTDPYIPVWNRLLDEARSQGLEGHPPYKLDFWGRALCWILEPPPKFRFPTPPPFHPVELPAADQVLPQFLSCQDHILAAMQSARGLAIDGIKLHSPFDVRVRYSIWSSFCVTAAHQRRHLWQAERAAAKIVL
jgi:hypothetical protein